MRREVGKRGIKQFDHKGCVVRVEKCTESADLQTEFSRLNITTEPRILRKLNMCIFFFRDFRQQRWLSPGMSGEELSPMLQGSGQEVEPQWGGEGVPEAMAGQQGGLPGEEGHLPTGGEVLQAEVEGPLAGEEVHQELAAPGAGGDHQVLPGGGGHREHITLPERATGRGETGCSSGPTAGRWT